MSDCIPRDSPGVDFDAFYEIISKVARNWASEQAIPILKHLFSHFDRNKDQVSNYIIFKKKIHGYGGISADELKMGTIIWDWEDDEGKKHSFKIPNSYYTPNGRIRLLSPQHWNSS